MTEHSMKKRLADTWAEAGPAGTYRMVADYVRWRAHGSPIGPPPSVDPDAYDPPLLEDWLDAYAALRPERGTANPETGFSIVCPVYNTPPAMLADCVDSVIDQTHREWELILVDDASTSSATREALAVADERDGRVRVVTLDENGGIAAATNAGIAAVTNEYTIFMDHDDRLAPSALEWVSVCCPRADLIYTDEDKITEDGDHWGEFFKPSWSPRMLLGNNYINHLTCIRTSLLRDVGGIMAGTDGVQDHDLLMRVSERDITVAHVPYVAYHWRAWSESVAGNPSSKTEVEARGLEAVQRAIERRGWQAQAALGDGAPFNYRVIFDELSPRPTVKIVIPTRDRLKMLRQAVDGVLDRTDGVDVHIVVVDNGSKKSKTLAYLEEIAHVHQNVTVLRIDDAFNFSLLCNAGAAAGPQTPYILFLNNDIEIVHRRWLQQLVGWLDADPAIVGVGPKLLFPDHTIQHAGVIVGFGGVAGHYAAREPNQPQLGNLHDQAREVGCLTAACLLVRSEDFAAVEGFNETLHLDFQDVDFSLRLRTLLDGELMYDPTYPLIHEESATRGTVGAASGYTVARMHFLWGNVLGAEDEYYSPHLSLRHHDFSLRPIPEGEARLREAVTPRWTPNGRADSPS